MQPPRFGSGAGADLPPRQRGSGRYCLDCRYPLRGLDSPGQCPECGRQFDFADWTTFALDSTMPTIVDRAVSRRGIALIGAMALEAFCLWSWHHEWCMFGPAYLIAHICIILMLFTATNLDQSIGRTFAFFLFGILFGVVTGAPAGPVGALMGVPAGFFAGCVLQFFNKHGFLD